MDYSTLRLPLLEARCDWLTGTCELAGPYQSLLYLCESISSADEKAGDRIETWAFQGYRGFQTSGVRYGQRDDGAIGILSGPNAQAHIRKFAELTTHWSRIDYCVTGVDDSGRINPPKDYYVGWSAVPGANPKRSSATLIQNSVGGATISIGARSSAYYLRCYDKAAESKGQYPPGSWRWEVELKRHASEGEFRRWREHPVSEGFIKAIVAHEFHRQGCYVPWTRDDGFTREPPPPRVRDADRALDWLNEQVRPCVDWLMEARGEARVLGALGIHPRNLNEISTELNL